MTRLWARFDALVRQRPGRWGLVVAAAAELGLGVMVVIAAVLWQPDLTPHPERVTATVTGCEVKAGTGAQVSYSLSNGDRSEHKYRVQVLVATATAALGSSVSLVNHVGPGTTVQARALVPISGNPAGAECSVQAVIFEGTLGHHDGG